MRILLVEDESHIAHTLAFNFSAQGYQTHIAPTGEEALERLDEEEFDIVVLDVMLPGIDGFEVARTIRRQDPKLPILMLTALSADEDRIAGLECGVDDYLVKPFVLKELMLRIAGLLRRAHWNDPSPAATFPFGAATVDPAAMRCSGPGGTREITRIELDLMRYFAARPGRLVSRRTLLQEVWGYEPDIMTRTVDTFVMRVRKMVEPEPRRPVHLRSVRGEGYIYHPDGGGTDGRGPAGGRR